MEKVNRIEMTHINGSNIVRYSVVLNDKLVQYQTDGYFLKHITKQQFIKLAKEYNNKLQQK